LKANVGGSRLAKEVIDSMWDSLTNTESVWLWEPWAENLAEKYI
jgi:hypothetical protein